MALRGIEKCWGCWKYLDGALEVCCTQPELSVRGASVVISTLKTNDTGLYSQSLVSHRYNYDFLFFSANFRAGQLYAVKLFMLTLEEGIDIDRWRRCARACVGVSGRNARRVRVKVEGHGTKRRKSCTTVRQGLQKYSAAPCQKHPDAETLRAATLEDGEGSWWTSASVSNELHIGQADARRQMDRRRLRDGLPAPAQALVDSPLSSGCQPTKLETCVLDCLY